MTSARDDFRTAVRGIEGVWPRLPDAWSFSSLRDAEGCPRRWMLSRATYPSVWNHAGYPPRPTVSALVGDVVHRILETIIQELHSCSCSTVTDPCAVEVLKGLGGYSTLIERAIDERLDRLADNPRVASRIDALRTALRARVPDIRQRVQTVISRSNVKPTSRSTPGRTEEPWRRGPVGEGSYPEVELRAPELRFMGRVDLLTVEDGSCGITDFKTGAPDAWHAEQLKLYALLWSRDREVNPKGLRLGQLLISYTRQDEALDPPNASELDALAQELAARIADAERYLRLRPPPARPSAETCRYCSVRHLCDEYWAGLDPTALRAVLSQDPRFADCEVNVVAQNGPRSWLVEIEPARTPALLRTPTETPGLQVGRRVRLLDLAVGQDDDSGRATLAITQASERFVLNDGHRTSASHLGGT